MPPKKAPIPAKKPENDFVKDDFVTELDGVEIRLPSLSYMTPGIVRVIRNMSDIDQTFTILEKSLTAEAMAKVDTLDPEEFNDLLIAWRDHSGITLGES